MSDIFTTIMEITPAFYYATETSRWVNKDSPTGLFFVFAPWFATEIETEDEARGWQEALNTVHAFPESGIFIAMNFDCT